MFTTFLFIPLVVSAFYSRKDQRLAALLPYQSDYTSLSPELRVVLRELRSTVLDIEEAYQEFGEWPETLERLRGWTATPNPTWVDYQRKLDSENIVLRVIDLHSNYHPHPHPGIDYDPHDLLASQMWVAAQDVPFRPLQLPETGWKWAITRESWDNLQRKTVRPEIKSDNPRIGVTLRVYYSWAKAILGNEIEVVGILPEHADPHTFQPSPDDVAKVGSLDLLIEHGLGHDVFLPLLTRATEFPEERVFSLGALASYELDTIEGEKIVNPHNFLSLTGAAEQVTILTEELGRRIPAHSESFKENAKNYIDEIYSLLTSARTELEKLSIPKEHKPRFAVVHTGFNYLLQDLGVSTDIVVEPRHGLNPSVKQLADTITRIRKAGVKMLIVDAQYPAKVSETIQRESGCHIVYFSHLDHGPYTKERFIETMRQNIDTLITGIRLTKGEKSNA